MGVMSPDASLRYLLSVSLVLFGAVALKGRRRWTAGALGLWAAYTFHEEISQTVYALPGLAMMAGACLLSRQEESRRAILLKMITAAAAFAVGVAVFAVSLVWNGQLRQWWEFVSSMGVMSNYSGWPANVALWFSVPSTLDQFLVFLSAALLVGGMLQAVWTRFGDVHLLVPG